ncbi:3-oxoacyl-[acyl-carrier-protein] synthase III C-terminal domain-containing protein [Chlorobium limicola]|uniref:Beta-ketoacyl-[acyl-carrier-protein] synthase III C-terminal domain-containing protein n=1 Tax=Chlorobium limicola TaxID=1092 RepID=A0A117MS50_CHLLI|nr:3-oxoacyl-[acyl-carrier-protein] synthase III C-terminal domain-containing protein [Chlorobium limicola]KUL32844.1 hypothetical protein ASB62_01050 [Chlorobium limicola]
MSKIETVLTDIHSARLHPLVPQELSCNLLKKGMTKALAVKSGTTSSLGVYAIAKKVDIKFSLFGMQASDTRQRYMALWNHDYDLESDSRGLVENGKFISYDIAFPMYEQLARHHTNPEGSNLHDRMDLYRLHAEQHIRQLYEQNNEIPDNIIFISSTGYIDPNPVSTVMSAKQWHDIDITNFYHHACNAPIPAIRMANALLTTSLAGGCEKPKKRIDMVSSEMFSLHMRLADDRTLNVGLISTYSDSFLRYSIRSYQDVLDNRMGGLKILAFRNMTFPNTSAIAMWSISDPCFYFDLKLLDYLKLIKTQVRHFVDSFYAENGMDFRSEKDHTSFVIQGSSQLTLKQIAEELELSENQISLSRETLLENGYLSSGAIPFMCKRVIEEEKIPSGTKVFCLGYAQGITMSGMLLEKV